MLVIFGFFITMKLAHLIGLRSAYSDLHLQSTSHLNNLIFYIENTLGRFEKVPEVLSRHPLLREVLLQPENPDKRKKLNVLLEEIKTVTQASDTYLIDADGVTLAASNWKTNHSFVDMNFSVRPYFQQAMAGDFSRYYAVGLSSNKRGYYFAYPIRVNNKVLGVIALKVSIDDIENQHKETVGENDYNFLIVAPDDVVFIADEESWRLKTIGQLTPKKAQSLEHSKRYAGREIAALNVTPYQSYYLPDTINASLLKIKNDGKERVVFAQNMQMLDVGWRVHLWSSLDGIEKQKALLTISSASGYLLLLFLVLFTKEKIKNAKNQRNARLLLEQKVEERTADLTASNNQLVAEIKQRIETQAQLNKTQNELIQSAKLAVIGSMSASINHEINQPLTALRSYSQNALSYQDRGQVDKARYNLKLIITLVDRLADIVGQFKNFSKKSEGTALPVCIQESISAALSIIKHQAQQESVQLFVDTPETLMFILGDEIRLEQVLVNLFSNAIQAMADEEEKKLHIQLSSYDDKVTLVIRDTGTGILEANLSKIFDPFFTTKESFGLGLGLSISQRIIESMQGSLNVTNHAEGGAKFTIELPLHH